MIGIIAKEIEKDICKEFFELFKTPWEFYRPNRSYDVIISTGYYKPQIKAKLVVIFGVNKTAFDDNLNIKKIENNKAILVEAYKLKFPIYKEVVTYGTELKSVVKVSGKNVSLGIETNSNKTRLLRIGYNLFNEIKFLLTEGQPKEFADYPTLEIHIMLIRSLIFDAGITFIEIPAVPSGYNFMVCLTHDVDFAGIKRHKIDSSVLGFLYRALLCTFFDFIKGNASWKKLVTNWKSAFSLPLVHLGIIKDFWLQFEKYIEIEKDLAATYYMVPYKNRDGINSSQKCAKGRAAKYDILDIKEEVRKLIACGCEIGLHGIDAWRDAQKASKEKQRIDSVTRKITSGIRMHWLFFDGNTPQILDRAGFKYDTTFGYNDAVGYRGGTVQAFSPAKTKRLLELPMHIQDTSMFYPKRMGLTVNEAKKKISSLLNKAKFYGGVLTINWHQRSIGPERLWHDFYEDLLKSLTKFKVWYGTASEIVDWFKIRRTISFQCRGKKSKKICIKFNNKQEKIKPPMILRIYRPNKVKSKLCPSSPKHCGYNEILLNGNTEIDIYD